MAFPLFGGAEPSPGNLIDFEVRVQRERAALVLEPGLGTPVVLSMHPSFGFVVWD